jgi:gliding motility-associated-like protein
MEPKNELDKIFKEGLENARFEAPAGAWEAISSSVSSSASQVFWTATTKWIAGVAISAITVGIVAGIWMSSPQDSSILQSEKKVEAVSTEEAADNAVNNNPSSAAVEQQALQNDSKKGLEVQHEGKVAQDHAVAEEPIEKAPSVLGESRETHAKPQSTKPHSSKPQAVPTHITSGQKTGFDCTGSLKIKAEKISNTAWSFQATSSAGTIEWYFGDGVMDYGLMSSHEFSDRPAQYNVTAYSIAANGCRDSAKLKVRVEGAKPELVNIFTPDGDGFNDAYFVNVPYAELYELKIYDKMNRLVFQTHDPNERWDGTCREMPCPAGKYRITFNYKYPGDEKASTATQIVTLSRKQN